MSPLTRRNLASKISLSDTYISKVENQKLHFGDFPKEQFIHKLADVLNAAEEKLLLLANKVPAGNKKRGVRNATPCGSWLISTMRRWMKCWRTSIRPNPRRSPTANKSGGFPSFSDATDSLIWYSPTVRIN